MKKTKKTSIEKRHEDQGFVLVVGIIVMTSLLLLVTPFLFQLSTEYRLTQKTFKSSAAISLAEAGIERAIWELNYGDIATWDGDDSLRTMTIPSFQSSGGNVIGDIEIRVEDPTSENPVIESTGRVSYIGSQELVVRATRVVLKEADCPPLFDYAAFGVEGLILESNAMIDSYDSRDGLYGGSNITSNGHAGTNATHYGCIDLNSNAKIYGNAVSGPESDPETDIITRSNSEIYGEKLSLSSSKEMPSILPPEALPYKGDYYMDAGDQFISESGEYSSFMIDGNARVTITEDVTLYVTDEFSLKSNSQLYIADGVTVTIYLGGSFIQHSNTQINNLSEDPTKLLVLGTDSFNNTMEWKSNSDFWGAIYVPKADVEFSSNSEFCGSIVAKSIDLSSNTNIHYDEALADLDIGAPSESSSYAVRSWQEILSQ